jgi:hypothetical protein
LALLDDAIDGGEAEASARTTGFGGEKGSKICARVFSSMPIPVSATSSTTHEPEGEKEPVASPGGWAASRVEIARLATICSIWAESERIQEDFASCRKVS